MLIIVDEEATLRMVELVGGEDAAKTVKVLMKKPSLSDDGLSESLGMDIKEVRKVLHKLNDLGLVAYDVYRDKDTGHRIFKWRVQRDQVIGFARTQMRKIYERLKARVEFEQSNQMYRCGTPKCRSYTFDEAMDKLFRCPVCKQPLALYDNTELIGALQRRIEELEKNLK